MRWQPRPVRIEAMVKTILANQGAILAQLENIMSDLSHLNTALSDL
jgi:hypothetical protein